MRIFTKYLIYKSKCHYITKQIHHHTKVNVNYTIEFIDKLWSTNYPSK